MELGVRSRFVWFQSHALCTTHGTFPHPHAQKVTFPGVCWQWGCHLALILHAGRDLPPRPSIAITVDLRAGLTYRGRHSRECSLWRENSRRTSCIRRQGGSTFLSPAPSVPILKQPKTLQAFLCAAQFGMKPTLSQLNGVRERWYNSESKDLWTVFPLVVRFFCIAFEWTDVKPQLVSSFLWGPFDSQSTEFSIVIFHRSNSCWQPLCVILFT